MRESSKCLWSACLALAILGSGLGGAVSLSKPPDVPADLGLEVGAGGSAGRDYSGYDLFTGKLSLSFSLPWNVWQYWLPEDLPGAKNGDCKRRLNADCPPREGLTQTRQEPTTLQENQARTLFEIAERCLKNGDFDKARTCFEETHMLAPETSCGRKAIERLADIDSGRIKDISAGAEQQEPRAPTVMRSRN